MRAVFGYQGLYSVDHMGNVYSHRRNKMMAQSNHICGYKQVGLTDRNGKKSMLLIHRLVAIAYKPNLELKEQVNHLDGIKTNNHISNLEWVTPSENNKHAYATRLKIASRKSKNTRADNGRAVLTEQSIVVIRKLLITEMTQKAISQLFGVHETTISNIKTNKSWKV